MKMLLSIVVLVVVSLTSAEGLSLSLSYPDSSNPSIIRFTCKNGEDRAVTATFQKNGEEITDQVSVIINSAGILEFMSSATQGLGGTFTCTDNGITSNAVTLPSAIFTSELSDKTVEGGNTVEFVCAVVASDYQPEIVWIFDSEVITGCNEDSNYCIQNEKVEFARLTTSTFVIETEEEEESSTHLITCYVEQKHTERKMAKLTVKASDNEDKNEDSNEPDSASQSGGSSVNEAGIIGGTSVSALVVLVTTTIITTVVVMWRRYLRRKQLEASGHEICPAPEDHEVAIDIDEEKPITTDPPAES